MPDRNRGAARRLAVALVALCACLGLLWVVRVPLLRGVGQALVYEEGPPRADVILLLNGEVETRPFHAARLYREGAAPRILVGRVEDSPATELGLWPNETDVNIDILQQEGVPSEAIEVISQDAPVASTHDEAQALARIVERENLGSVLVVTSRVHTARSRWVVRRTLAGASVDVRVSAAPQYGFTVHDWWTCERGLVAVLNEYIKFGYYLLSY